MAGLEAVKFPWDDELFPWRARAKPRPAAGAAAELAKFGLMRSDDEFWAPWFRPPRGKDRRAAQPVSTTPPSSCRLQSRHAASRSQGAASRKMTLARRPARARLRHLGAGARRELLGLAEGQAFAERRVATRTGCCRKETSGLVKRRRSTLVSRPTQSPDVHASFSARMSALGCGFNESMQHSDDTAGWSFEG